MWFRIKLRRVEFLLRGSCQRGERCGWIFSKNANWVGLFLAGWFVCTVRLEDFLVLGVIEEVQLILLQILNRNHFWLMGVFFIMHTDHPSDAWPSLMQIDQYAFEWWCKYGAITYTVLSCSPKYVYLPFSF